MTSEDVASRPEGVRGYVRFSAKLARVVCARVAAGESQLAICADPGMPSRATLGRWARERPAFARIFARARALGGRNPMGRPSSYCPVVAHEVLVRVTEGETLSSISRDPAMPSMDVIFHWRRTNADFAQAMRQAREVLAERFCDMGWQMAMEATPETAHLTRVRLAQLRWTAAILSPRSHGRIKASEPETGPQVQSILFRHFKIEIHPETGQRRVVGYTPDPSSMRPVRDAEGPWSRLPDTADLSPETVAAHARDIAAMRALVPEG